MKKIFILLAFVLFSCSSEEQPALEVPLTCYNILARGTDQQGDFIIIKYSNYTQKKYSVSNYLDYLNLTKICEPINLTEQAL